MWGNMWDKNRHIQPCISAQLYIKLREQIVFQEFHNNQKIFMNIANLNRTFWLTVMIDDFHWAIISAVWQVAWGYGHDKGPQGKKCIKCKMMYDNWLIKLLYSCDIGQDPVEQFAKWSIYFDVQIFKWKFDWLTANDLKKKHCIIICEGMIHQ